MKLSHKLRVLLPCILVSGATGALVGGSWGEPVHGLRIGIIAGGIVAFWLLRRRSLGAG